MIRRLAIAAVLLLCAASTEAAVTARTNTPPAGYVSATISGNSTVTEPTSCASGDMEVAVAVADSGTSLARPAGWTQKFSGTQGALMFDVSYVSRGGSAPSLTWSVTGTSKYREIEIICLTGSATVTFDAASSSGATGNGASHTPNAPAVTAVASTSLAVAIGINYVGSGAGGWTAPSGYAIKSNATAGNDNVMGTKSLAAAGSEDPGAFTNLNGTGAFDYWDGAAMTFTDAGGGGAACTPTLTLMRVGRCG